VRVLAGVSVGTFADILAEFLAGSAAETRRGNPLRQSAGALCGKKRFLSAGRLVLLWLLLLPLLLLLSLLLLANISTECFSQTWH